MTATQWLLASAGTGVAIIGGWLSVRFTRSIDKREKERALGHMSKRPAFDDAGFGCHYFPDGHAEIAARVRRILARHIPVDLSRLHPDDALVEDIRMDALDSMSTVEVVLEVEEEFRISIPDLVARDMRTSRDIIDYVAGHFPGPSLPG